MSFSHYNYVPSPIFWFMWCVLIPNACTNDPLTIFGPKMSLKTPDLFWLLHVVRFCSSSVKKTPNTENVWFCLCPDFLSHLCLVVWKSHTSLKKKGGEDLMFVVFFCPDLFLPFFFFRSRYHSYSAMGN